MRFNPAEAATSTKHNSRLATGAQFPALVGVHSVTTVPREKVFIQKDAAALFQPKPWCAALVGSSRIFTI
jgi:hypothetical protein